MKMKGVLVFLFVLAGLLLLTGPPAYADVFTGSDGFGSTFTLTSNCGASNDCAVTLAINTAGVSASLTDISAVAFKIGSTDTFGGILTPPNGTWNTSNDSLSNGGCGSNGDNQICSEAATTSDYAATGGILPLTWTWTDVQVDQDVINHVGYKYNNAGGTLNGHIVSIDDSNTTPMPEPTSLSLLFLGLMGAAGLTRLRRQT